MASIERIDDDYVMDNVEDGSSDDDYDPGAEVYGEGIFDPCSICDNGGLVVCCEGICKRSFHATQETAADALSGCVSLGLTENEVQAMQRFECENCQYKVHQCFSCGQLGSSDMLLGAQVFQCGDVTCGYFYHPHCVANQLHPHSEDAAAELRETIRAGEPFTCPLHVCFVCRQPEDQTNYNLQMAMCRRCPKAYHRRCLPRRIAFYDNEAAGEFQRAWEGLCADRILIYCLNHEIIDGLRTPLQNHIRFPGDANEYESATVADISADAPSYSESTMMGV